MSYVNIGFPDSWEQKVHANSGRGLIACKVRALSVGGRNERGAGLVQAESASVTNGDGVFIYTPC